MQKKKIILYVLLVIVIIGIIVTFIVLNTNKENSDGNNKNNSNVESTVSPSLTPSITNTQNPNSITNELGKQEKALFNSNFDFYVGSNVKGSKVKSLIATIKYSNSQNNARKIDLIIDGDLATDASKIKASGSYSVSFEYDTAGFICKALVNEN